MEEKPNDQPMNELEKGKEETVVKPKKKDGRGKPRTEAQKAATAKMLARKEEVRATNRKAKADAKEKEIEDAVEKRIKNKKITKKKLLLQIVVIRPLVVMKMKTHHRHHLQDHHVKQRQKRNNL